VQSVLQRQRNAAGHEDGLGKYNDNRGRVLRVRDRVALGQDAKLQRVFQQCTDVLRRRATEWRHAR